MVAAADWQSGVAHLYLAAAQLSDSGGTHQIALMDADKSRSFQFLSHLIELAIKTVSSILRNTVYLAPIRFKVQNFLVRDAKSAVTIPAGVHRLRVLTEFHQKTGKNFFQLVAFSRLYQVP